MSKHYIGSGGIEVYQAGGYVMFSADRQFSAVVERAMFPQTLDPLRGLDFYSYVEGPSVVVLSGRIYQARLAFVDDPGVITDNYSITGFTPNSSGVIYFSFSIDERNVVETGIHASAPVVEIPAGGNGYYTSYADNFVLDELGGAYAQTAPLIAEVMPEPQAGIYTRRILDFTVSEEGVPSIQQIHIGPIRVTHGYRQSASFAMQQA